MLGDKKGAKADAAPKAKPKEACLFDWIGRVSFPLFDTVGVAVLELAELHEQIFAGQQK